MNGKAGNEGAVCVPAKVQSISTASAVMRWHLMRADAPRQALSPAVNKAPKGISLNLTELAYAQNQFPIS